MTVARSIRKRNMLAILVLSLAGLVGVSTQVTAQTQPQPRRTPPRTTPPRSKPTPPADPNAQPPVPTQPQPTPPRTTPSEPAAQPHTPLEGEQAQPSEPVGRDETGRVRIDPEVQKKIDEMLKQDAANRKPGESRPPNQPENPAGAVPDPTVPNPAGSNPAAAQNPPGAPSGGTPTPDPMKTPAQRAAERRRARNPGADGANANPPGSQIIGQPRPGAQPGVEAAAPPEPPGESTVIQIEPEPEANPVPLEERRFSFSIKNGTYEQLIKGFAHQTGLGVLGEAPKDGTVTFETTETLSFKEALGRVRMLLFNYKPHDPYWMLYEDTHLKVIRVTDLYRVLPTNRMFRSMEELEQANLPDDEIVLVIYTPKTGSFSELRQVRDFLPDYVRITPMEDGVSVSIFALISDIKKYMELIDKVVPTSGSDPRITERFEVHNITATQAVDRLRQLADLDNTRNPPMPRTGVRGAQPQLETPMSDPLVVLIPDDSQNYILVRGMANKIEEIRKLLPFVDVSIAQEAFAPVVVKVHHADASDLITAIQQVLAASAGPSPMGVSAPPLPSSRRGKKPAGGGVPTAQLTVSADSINMLVHPTQNAILVMADEAGVKKVQDLVNMFDVQASIGPLRIPLQAADASEVVSTITLVLGGGAPGAKGAAPESYQLVPDPSGGFIWYSGSESDLERVKALIEALDVAGNSPTLHIVRLVYKQPSFVADILRQYDGVAPQSAAPAPAGDKPKTRRATVKQSASKFTPDDPQKKLYILCNTDDFNRYQEIIAKLDVPEGEKDVFIRVPVKHIDSATAADKLAITMTQTTVNQDVRVIAVDGALLLVGASPTDVDIIRQILAEFDRPSTIETRTFIIKHADPSDIKTAIETLVNVGSTEGRSSAPARRRPRPAASSGGEGAPRPQAPPSASADATVSDEMTILQMGNKLVVKASPPVLDQVAAVIEQFDVEGAGSDMRVYSDFPPNSDITGISETLVSVFAGGAKVGRGKGGAVADGPRFIPQPATNRLVIMAEPSQFGEIEKLLNILRIEAGSTEPSIVEFIPVEHADPAALVEEIRPILDMKIRGLVESGEIAEASAESTQPTTVPRAGRAKNLQKAAAGGGEKYHIGPDAHNERVVVAAPQRIVEEAKVLIKQFDIPAKAAKIVFRQVTLENASPAEMVKSIKEIIGRPGGSGARRPATPPTRPTASPGTAPASSPLEGLGGEGLVVTEAPGGGAVLLKGTQAEVDQAEDWIHQLDAMSTRGRKIKLYDIVGTDTEKLFDLIVSVVDGGGAGGARPTAVSMPKRGLGGAKATESTDEDEFSTSRTHATQDFYLHADLIRDTLMVATTPSKLQQVDDLVQQFTADESLAESMRVTQVPSFRYTLEYADAYDASSDLEDLIDAVWRGKEKPKVDYFKDMLIVDYPDESRFDEIRAMIKDIDKPSEETVKTVRKSFVPPAGLSPEATVRWFQQNHPDYEFETIDLGEGKIQPEFGMQRVTPPKTNNNGNGNRNGSAPANPAPVSPARGRVDAAPPAALPPGFNHVMQAVACVVLAQTPPDEEPPLEEQPEDAPPQEEEEPVMEEQVHELPPMPPPAERNYGDQLIRQATKPLLPPGASGIKPAPEPGKEEKPSTDKKKKGKKKARLIYDNTQGVYWIEGTEDDVEELDESRKDLDTELDKIYVPPDIRIYQVRYIDVYSATEIIEEMFNATKAMQAHIQQQQNMAIQQQRAAQAAALAQQRAQQGQPGQGRGQEGKDGARPGQPGQLTPQQLAQQQQQLQVPQLPAPAVRVTPNPRDRTLILRAETSQYPYILELLATIDQPKPIDSKTKTFPLKKVNATEMEHMLREALRLDEAGARPKAATRVQAGPGGPTGGAGPSTSPGGSLPETILQQSVTGSLLGVDPQDITLFSSETANSIIAMAPPAALEYIGKLIEQFESGDIPERLTRFYELQHAFVTDVAQQLTDYFAAKNPRSGGRASRKGGEGAAPAASSEGGLNAPSFIAYERLNQLTVHATEEQLKEIENVLTRLDVASEEDAWKDVALAYADAKVVADTLSEMFGAGGGAGAPGKGGRPAGASAAGAAAMAKFIGEAGGRMVFFNAPKARHAEILTTIAKIEEKSQQTSKPRVIELKNATPSQIAEAIEKAYDTKRTGQQGGAAPKAARFTVTAHDPTHKLFVVADDDMFAQISSLITTLDVPGSGINVEFRIYPLQYASAKAVHGQMTKLMTDYIQRLGAKAKDMEAFSVQPDETANALVVLGTPSVFGFIEENLRKIDTPAAKATMPEAHVVELKNADPDAVTRALTEIFVRNAPKGADGDVPISVSAASGSKAVVIRANAVDFAKMQAVITQLDTEDIATSGEVRVVTINFADASEIKTALETYLSKPTGPGGSRSAQLVGDVRLSVMPQTNALMISGDMDTLDRLEGIVKGMDIAGEKGSVPQIIPLKFATAALVLPALKETFSDPKFGGGRKNYAPPVIVADEASNALIVRAAPQELAAIESFVAKLDIEGKADKSGPRIVQVAAGVNVEDLAEQIEQSINESAKARMGNSKGATIPSIIAIPNQRTSSITLAGSAMLYDEAESMIHALEKMRPAGGVTTAVIAPKNIATEDLQRLIDQLTQKQSSGGGGRRGGSSGSSTRPRQSR